MGFSDSLTLGIEIVMGILIFLAFLTALAPTVIGLIQNNSTVIGLPEVTLLVFSLLGLIFVMGAFMKLWKKLTEPDRPEIQY